MVQEEAAQNLVQGPVHLQPGWSSHQPLQQLLQLFSHMLRRKRRSLMTEEQKLKLHQIQPVISDLMRPVGAAQGTEVSTFIT